MDEHDPWLAQRFEKHRTHLRAVAYRMLGSISEAEDALQDAWLRLSRSDTSSIENPGGWMTTVVGFTRIATIIFPTIIMLWVVGTSVLVWRKAASASREIS